jgi:hypothetical protein
MCIIINRDIHTFMYFGVLGEYAKILFASSPCTHRFFPRILRIHLNTFRVFGDDFVYRKFLVIYCIKQKLLYAYTETTLNSEISTESVYNSVNNNTN